MGDLNKECVCNGPAELNVDVYSSSTITALYVTDNHII